MKPPTTARISACKKTLIAVASLFFLCPIALADVYRCQSPTGKVAFSDAPCTVGNAGQAVDIRPNVVNTSDLREQMLRAENQVLKDQLAAKPAGSIQQPLPSNSEAWRIDTAACRTAKHDYEISASSIDKNPAMLRARESAMYGACGMREPDRTTVKIGNERSGSSTYLVPSTRQPVR